MNSLLSNRETEKDRERQIEKERERKNIINVKISLIYMLQISSVQTLFEFVSIKI
jgi:hypothetical protein